MSFASLGPKTYSYVTIAGRVEIKAKGISQNGYMENILGADLKQIGVALTGETFARVLGNKEEKLQIVYSSQEEFKKNFKDCSIRTVVLSKTIRPVHDKRILNSEFTTRAYGTKLYFLDDTIQF